MNGNCIFYLRGGGGGGGKINGNLFQLCWVPLGVVNLKKPPVYE